MGTVYLSHTRGGQPVALKLIRRELGQDEEFRRRFEQEVRAARQVQGYHLVPVVDHDTNGDLPWVATEFVSGVPLETALDSIGPLPLPAVFQLVGCTAHALTAIHAAGVVHRDLKPSNLMLSESGPYVIDFGIARAADATKITTSGKFIGTPQYMSPEHALGDPVGPASDLFSLGLIAAVAATGRHPYGEGGGLTVATQIANTSARPPDLSQYPGILRPLLERCLAAAPEARVTTAELAALCEEYGQRPLRDFDGWLPGPLSTLIGARAAAARTAWQQPPRPGGGTAGTPPEQGGRTGGGGRDNTVHTITSAGTPYGSAGDRFASTGGTHTATSPQAGSGPHNGPYGPHGQYAQVHPPTEPPRPWQRPTGAPAGQRPTGGGKKRPVLITCLSLVGALVLLPVLISFIVFVWPDDDYGGGKDDPGGGKDNSARASSSPQQPADGDEDANPTQREPGPEKLIDDQPFALRAPADPSVVDVDFDEPKIYGAGDIVSGQELVMNEVSGGRWEFETPMGISSGTKPEQCRQATGSNVLAGEIESTELTRKRTIKVGTVLCTETSEGNLAMLVVERITPSSDSDLPDVYTRLTLWRGV